VTVAHWQASYRAETPLKLTAFSPPVTTVVHTRTIQGRRTYELRSEEEPAPAIGMALSASMVRLLGHDEGYGLAFPVRRALAGLTRHCRHDHKRWPDHAEQLACACLAYAVIANGVPLPLAAREIGIRPARADRLLRAAVVWMAAEQARWFAKETY
jgi:hypothetical protein